MQAHTEIGVENRNLGPGVGAIDPQPRDCGANPLPKSIRDNLKTERTLETSTCLSRRVLGSKSRVAVSFHPVVACTDTSRSMLPTVSPPRQCRWGRGEVTRVDQTAVAAEWKDDTCSELQDAILTFPFPFPCWAASFRRFTSGIDLHGQSNPDSVLHLSGVDRITIQHASMLASTNAALAR